MDCGAPTRTLVLSVRLISVPAFRFTRLLLPVNARGMTNVDRCVTRCGPNVYQLAGGGHGPPHPTMMYIFSLCQIQILKV